MGTFKLVEWNMEWMNDLFSADNSAPAFRPDGEKTAHSSATVKQRRKDLGGALDELNADVVVVVEGPNRKEELQLFFDKDVTGDWVTHIQKATGSQAVGVAVRTDRGAFAASPLRVFDTKNPQEFPDLATFLDDTDDDDVKEQYKFERPPLYVEITAADGKKLRILGVHLKSKGIFSAMEWSKWWSVAGGNRKKLIAQARRLRTKLIEPYLQDAATKGIPLIVSGDINDGPGFDALERALTASGVETLMCDPWKPASSLRNALFETLAPGDQDYDGMKKLATSRFKDPIFNDVYHEEWIDHILFTGQHGDWVRNAAVCTKTANGKYIWETYKHASDHIPISAVITL